MTGAVNEIRATPHTVIEHAGKEGASEFEKWFQEEWLRAEREINGDEMCENEEDGVDPVSVCMVKCARTHNPDDSVEEYGSHRIANMRKECAQTHNPDEPVENVQWRKGVRFKRKVQKHCNDDTVTKTVIDQSCHENNEVGHGSNCCTDSKYGNGRGYDKGGGRSPSWFHREPHVTNVEDHVSWRPGM